ncbi:uncharacterized protein BDV17DRAFT_285448 [Aspergillus undulatus]|uniref:uncharacterized protein n=1 Tax=Aspergillus undulatus TaxID=1810928 RepID=UPI003CCD1A63
MAISSFAVARRIAQEQPGAFEISEPILDETMTRLLVPMNENHTLWDLKSSRLVKECFTLVNKSWRWTIHPQDNDILLLFVGNQAQIYSWSSFDLLSGTTHALPPSPINTSSSNSEGNDAETDLDITHAISPAQCQSICLVSSRAQPSAALSGTKQDIIGAYRKRQIFLQNSGWVCSVDLETLMSTLAAATSYTRHFFVPPPWHSTITSPAVAITPQGIIILSVRDEISVFHSGLESEELVLD